MGKRLIPNFVREDFFEAQGRTSLDEFILLNKLNTSDLWADHAPIDELNHIRTGVEKYLASETKPDKIYEIIKADFKSLAPVSNGTIPYVELFLTSIISASIAKHAVIAGDCGKAWAHITHASYTTHEIIVNELLSLIPDARSKGGKRKKEKNRTIIDEAVRLLTVKKPPEGWKSKKEASRVIIEELRTHFDNEAKICESNLTRYNLESTLYRWLLIDEDVRTAFESNCASKYPAT